MFSLNGIVYASEKTENIQVVSAKPLDDMMILTFSTGEQRLFDATILTGEAFAPLSDENIFKNYKVVAGVVTWLDEEIDCAPEYMYTNSYEYPSLKSVLHIFCKTHDNTVLMFRIFLKYEFHRFPPHYTAKKARIPWKQ